MAFARLISFISNLLGLLVFFSLVIKIPCGLNWNFLEVLILTLIELLKIEINQASLEPVKHLKYYSQNRLKILQIKLWWTKKIEFDTTKEFFTWNLNFHS